MTTCLATVHKKHHNTAMKAIVSACLAGLNCRYDCKNQERPDIVKMVRDGEAIPLCPEQLGGLPTPRIPAEIVEDRVMAKNGSDVTSEYKNGASEALKMATLLDARKAYLKSKSPMCGHGMVYDGSFSGSLTKGNGIFAQLLEENGIEVISVD